MSNVLDRAAAVSLTWPLPADLDDAALRARLYPRAVRDNGHVQPDWYAVIETLQEPRKRRRARLTRRQLWVKHRDEVLPERTAYRTRLNGPGAEAEYGLVYGQGRLEAFIALGEKGIPAVVADLSEEDSLLMSLVENVARRHHRPMELLREIGALRERGYTDAQIARKIGFSRNTSAASAGCWRPARNVYWLRSRRERCRSTWRSISRRRTTDMCSRSGPRPMRPGPCAAGS